MWIPAETFAELAGISARKARFALARAMARSRPWRGANLEVRCVRGRGGRSGLRYEVGVDSLPHALQERLKESLKPTSLPLFAELTPRRSAEREWWLRILGPLLGMSRGRERAAAIDALAGRRDLADWRGLPIVLTPRTIHRRLQAYREQGALAFAPRVRADKGHAKVLISLAAETSIPFDDETWERIAHDLRTFIRGHWVEGATLKLIQGRSNLKFRELIEVAGFSHCSTLPQETFFVPRRFIEAERKYRHVHTLFRDRKTYEDNRYRVSRSRAGMMPMDWVIGDVHPLDIVIIRESDGRPAHARLIGWLDCATNRLRADMVLCEPGTGIRNADVIKSFHRMVTDRAWGMPKTLYIDNGREYRFADNLNDALQLVAQLRGGDGRSSRIAHAQPYNAAAKPIESMFAVLERMLQDVPGHTGGDRLNKKTEHVGHPTKAFPGTLQQLAAIVGARILEMQMYPMRGALNGKSPRQAYDAAVAAGWQPVMVDDREILTVFATDLVRTITKGVISYDSRNWRCPELAHYFEKRVIARVPQFWRPDKLALLHIKTREPIGVAEPIGTIAFDDPAGARISRLADKDRQQAIRELGLSVPALDTVAEGFRTLSSMRPAGIAEPIATVGLSDEASNIARALSEPPAERETRQRQARRARIAKAVQTYAPRDRSVFK